MFEKWWSINSVIEVQAAVLLICSSILTWRSNGLKFVLIFKSNGIVRQYTLVDDEKTMIQEFDWTKGGARHPVLNVKWVASTRSLLVATMQNVIMCKEQQSSLSEPTSTPLIKKNGNHKNDAHNFATNSFFLRAH